MIQQQSPEWYELRKNKIGASDAPIILEMSPFKTPYQLWLEKSGYVETNVTSIMQYGHDMENEVRNEFYRKTKIAVIPQVVIHADYDWMMASLDGLSADGKTAVEIKSHKSPHDFKYVKETGNVPEKYYAQVQQQMEVLDIDSMFYMCFYNGEFQLIEVERDDQFIQDMIPNLKKFHDCLKNGTPPPLSDRDKEMRDDESWKALAQEWLSVDEEISILKMKQDHLRDQLIEATAGKNVEGSGISVVKSVRRGNVDYSLIDALQNIDLNQYRKEAKEIWTIRKQKSN